jgi:hypothetical protein
MSGEHEPGAAETVEDRKPDQRDRQPRQRQPGEAPSMDEADRANGEPGAQD